MFCSICQDEDATPEGGFGRTQCHHFFHFSCWDDYIACGRRPTLSCPCCRRTVEVMLIPHNDGIREDGITSTESRSGLSTTRFSSDSSDDSESSTSGRSSYTYYSSAHDGADAPPFSSAEIISDLARALTISDPDGDVENRGHGYPLLHHGLGLRSIECGWTVETILQFLGEASQK